MDVGVKREQPIRLISESSDLDRISVSPGEWTEPIRGVLENTTTSRLVAEVKPIGTPMLGDFSGTFEVEMAVGKEEFWFPWSPNEAAPGKPIKFDGRQHIRVAVRYRSMMPCYIRPGLGIRLVGRW